MQRGRQLVIGIGIVLVFVVGWLVERQTGRDESTVQPPTTAEIVMTGLEIPWELAVLPSGELLVTERPGRLMKVGHDRSVIPIDGVAHQGEGGLLGLALHPKFTENGFIYLYLTTRAGDGLTNRVERYKLTGNRLSDRTTIIEGIPGASFHDGGRIAFGPDGLLYITTGDATHEANAQDRSSLAGKILRVADDGTIPADNPFRTAVYSLGHRNVQGIAWDRRGQLWATEHGRSGAQSGLDELNRIEPGGNYGWPTIQGDEERSGLIRPVVHSGPDTTWAPSGMTIDGDRILFAGLRGESVYVVTIDGETVSAPVAHLTGVYGRLRTVVPARDGSLYLLTNNRDGRGSPHDGDDRIIRLPVSAFD